jgi:hypothetical protein
MGKKICSHRFLLYHLAEGAVTMLLISISNYGLPSSKMIIGKSESLLSHLNRLGKRLSMESKLSVSFNKSYALSAILPKENYTEEML